MSGLESSGENKLVETRARHCVIVIGDLEKEKDEENEGSEHFF